MVINIYIKLQDGNGNVLQHYEEEFDSDISHAKKYHNNTVLRKNLEDFLFEHLSVSGLILREKLICKHPVFSVDYNNSLQPDSDMVYSKESEDPSEDNEMELSIRIGSRTVFTGKIELELPLCNGTGEDKPEAVLIQETEDTPADNTKEAAEEEEAMNISAFDLDIEKAEVKSILNYALQKAIEKYEANLCPSYREEALEYKETELETASSSVENV